MLEDQRCLRACDVGIGVQVLHDEGPEVVGVAGGHVQKKVVGAGKKVDVHHLRLAQSDELSAEGLADTSICAKLMAFL